MGKEMKLIWKGDTRLGPELTDSMIELAEQRLGVKLPASYLKEMRQRNGGHLRTVYCPTTRKTDWGTNFIQLRTVIGIGYPDGIDGPFGSKYMVAEWGYPDIGVLIADTPAGGHDAVMLDYRACGPIGEPSVAFIDEDRAVLPLAANFDSFVALLQESEPGSAVGVSA
jgi:hypothetical protein